MLRKAPAALIPLLASYWPLAALAQQAADAPTETVEVVYVVLFGILFFGMIAGFFLYMWWVEKKKEKKKKGAG